MKQSTFYYLLRRGLLRGISSAVRKGLVMFNKFTTAGISHPAQGSAEFDGASDYIQLNDPFSYTNHTIAAWVYANDTTALKSIFDNRDGSNDGVILCSFTDETILYQVNGVNQFSASYPNEWVFAVGTNDGATQKLYINGSLSVSISNTTSVSSTTNARIGRESVGSGGYMNGNLANVAIWNRALSSDEINSVMWKSYDGLTASETSGLQAWYSLDDITSPAASLANMEQLAADKEATIENKAAITAAINALS